MIFHANGFLRLRDQREIEGQNKKASNSGKTGNEGILRIPMKTVHRAGLILLFDGEVGPALRDHDEHNQTGILTSASILTPAFPNFHPVALGICSRYSGATVPDSHRVP
jgi:hypothetical protein